MIDLSISVVNTSNWAYLEPCLRSIFDSVRGIRFEVLVVDNFSSDGSAEKTRQSFPEVVLTENERRFGFAKNNNINLAKSIGRYVMLLNDDTIVLPGSLEAAVAYLDKNPDVGMVGCKMIDPDGQFQEVSARRFRTLLSTFLTETGIDRNYTGFHGFTGDRLLEIDLSQESGMVARREILDEVGFLDEQFFMFGEGPDWCRRIKKAGWRIVFLPEAKIIHFGNVTNKKMSLNMYLQAYKSTYLFFRKESALKGELFRAMIVGIYALKLMAHNMISLFSPGRHGPSDDRTYYAALVRFMLGRPRDPRVPFPVE